MSRNAGAALGVVAITALMLASCGKPPAEPQSPTVAQTTVPSDAPPTDPPAKPPEEPPVTPPEPPSVHPPGARGWRFGDDLTPFLEKGPPGLQELCGKCHTPPAPDVIVRAEWPRVLLEMRGIFQKAGRRPDPAVLDAVQKYYVESAPVDFERLPAAAGAGDLEFRKEAFGSLKRKISMVTNVNIADVDGDGRPEVLVCDGTEKAVTILRRGTAGWTEEVVASCEVPVHTAVFDADRDGDADIAVAGLGSMVENEDPVGFVLLLVNNGAKGWERRELAKGQPRVTDVEPADVDGDGDPDLIVGAFGGRRHGHIGWLRNDGAKWEFVKIADRAGTIHVPVADIDGDGRPDFVALVAQESESITVYLNKGGKFEPKIVFEARNPLFGSSGLDLVDLDRDGDLDMLFSNGDALSDPCAMPWPYHGVQWLENRGKLEYAYHDIGRCYGPFRAVASDLDGDGDTDVAVAVLFGMWADNGQTGLIWYENDGKMSFTRHDIPSPTHFITLAAGDLDADGTPELITGQISFLGAGDDQGDALLKWSIRKKK